MTAASPSAHALRMEQGSRSLLWRSHAETLAVRLDGATGTTLRGVFRRIDPNGEQRPDGLGATAYDGRATLVVRRDELAAMPGPKCEIDRNGETWYIVNGEAQDAWTWILHLSRRRPNLRVPR